MLSVEEIMQFIATKLDGRTEKEAYQTNPGRFIYEICMEIVRMAHEKESQDNMSIIIIAFDHKNNLKSHEKQINDDLEMVSNSDSVLDTDVSGDDII